MVKMSNYNYNSDTQATFQHDNTSNQCDTLNGLEKCQTFSLFSSNLLAPHISSLKQEVVDLIKGGNSHEEQCNKLGEIEKCGTYSTFATNLVTPYLTKLKTEVTELVKAGASQAGAAAEKASNSISNVVAVINTIPSMIRENSIFASKVVAVNMQALTDVLASEANPKIPPVTKDNMAIIKYLSEKQSSVYKHLLEYGNKSKDLPPERRAYELLLVNKTYVKAIVNIQGNSG